MRAALLACLVVGLLCTIGFVFIGVPYALLFGVVAGLLEFIPLVGPLAVALGVTRGSKSLSFTAVPGTLGVRIEER